MILGFSLNVLLVPAQQPPVVQSLPLLQLCIYCSAAWVQYNKVRFQNPCLSNPPCITPCWAWQSQTELRPTVRGRYSRRAGDNQSLWTECQICETQSPYFAHMVSQRDNQVRVWQSANLLPLRINSELNCVPLCPTCHMYFDCELDPGIVILPYDLDFFISYEEHDCMDRACPNHRSVPTIEDYKEHLRSKYALIPTVKSGLFQIFVLGNYLFVWLVSIEYYTRLSTQKAWGIVVLGSFHAPLKEVSDQLLKLRNLYFEHNQLVSPKVLELQHCNT